MIKYRDQYQPHHHDHRGAAHGEFQEPLSAEDLELAEASLVKTTTTT